jgi:hypothetical protein
MIGAEGVLEARVACAGIDEIRETQLPDVAQSLECRRVDELQRNAVDTDVVPERIAEYLVGHGIRENRDDRTIGR